MKVTLVDHIAINGDVLIKFITNPWVFGSLLFAIVICVYMCTHRHDKKTLIFKLEYEKPYIKTIIRKAQKRSLHGGRRRKK